MIGFNSVGDLNENENDQFVTRFLNDSNKNCEVCSTNYKSFHNGAAFFISNPLFESFVELCRVDNMTRIRLGRLLSIENFQCLRVKLGIITLKKMLAFICSKQSIVSARNIGLALYFSLLSAPNMATRYFSKFFPVFQLLIGLHKDNETENFSLKEFFAFELARELGIFDDFLSPDYADENVDEKKKQMIISFLYLSLLIVTERKLFNFSGEKFMYEQIVFYLKHGIHSIDHLNNLIDIEAIKSCSYSWIFNDILMDVSTTTKNNNSQQLQQSKSDQNESSKPYNKETLFYLKDGIEWNMISAINSMNIEMALMNDEISKDPNKLLQIPDFEPEETSFFQIEENKISSDGICIRLKRFLLTPTVLAVIYHTLRANCGNDSSNSDLNDHLAMNILILISKFIKEDDNDKSNASFDESTVIQYGSLVDLIYKLKRVVFNYHVDDKSNAFIEDTLNVKSFISLLKVKMSSSILPPKSFIDVLLEKGKLGHFDWTKYQLKLISFLIKMMKKDSLMNKT